MDDPKYSHLSYQKKYYLINKDKIKAYQKAYYQNKKTPNHKSITITKGKFILFKD